MISWISRLSALIAAYLFFAIGIIIAYEVIARYVFNTPTIWVEEVSRLMQLWGCYLSMGFMLKNRKMIRITLLLKLLSGNYAKLAELTSITIMALFSLITIYYASLITLDSLALDRHTPSMLGLPAWLFESSIVFGFILLFMQCLVEFACVCQQKKIDFEMDHDI
ncbi:TRAP transporter small permease [Pseudoalteromonas ostreae]|uniref:TRAP transporter small permease n=1 Tax=Pseudoalteromonas ostreae TaxID=2774154 RepID=UPI001B36ACB7|nr:TRAP transporter small permease [Pseudoalteromonas ostreae]